MIKTNKDVDHAYMHMTRRAFVEAVNDWALDPAVPLETSKYAIKMQAMVVENRDLRRF